MPTICQFYGIIILMYLRNKEHNPPHIHAVYGEFEASFLIESGEIFEGKFTKNGTKLVKQFIKENKDKLLEMWVTEKYEKLPPIK